jgi:hypothetical protein
MSAATHHAVVQLTHLREMRELFREGWNTQEIAELLNGTHGTDYSEADIYNALARIR